MLLRVLFSVLLLSFLVSCSSKKVEEKTPSVELTEEVEYQGEDDLFAEETTTDEDLFASESTETTETVSSSYETTTSPSAQSNLGYYTVQKYDTLMLIAFKLYGDYNRWRELRDMNQGTVNNSEMIYEGTKLAYNTSGSGFSWTPAGNPYLIKFGDTLGTISSDVYGVMSRWKEIWNNNRPLISNPNRIYAGFTLFYVPDKKVALK